MNKFQRKEYNIPEEIQCKICYENISPYNLTKHIKLMHAVNINNYVQIYGEFRKSKLQINNDKKRNIKKLQCNICKGIYSIVGFHTHLRDSHQIHTEDYIKIHGEYRPKYINYQRRSETNSFKCTICGLDQFASHKHFAYHVRIEHSLDMKEYAVKYLFDNNIPTCKCGCSGLVTLKAQPPYFSEYLSGHNPNAMLGKRHSTNSKYLMSLKAIEREYKGQGKHDTSDELKFKSWLIQNKIEFKQQVPTIYGNIDFYLPDQNMYIEIDGEYWHPIKLQNLTLQTLQSAINQLSRKGMENLIRIRGSHLSELNSIFEAGDLYRLNFEYDYSIGYKQVIIAKEYIQTLPSEKREQICSLLLKLIRKLDITFPFPTNNHSLEYIIKNLQQKLKVDLNCDIFSNNISTAGISYLKSIFQSYWKSAYNKSISPIEVWSNDELLYKVLCWRSGLNKNNETYDLSLHQILRGISASRYSISFFKPSLASNIYWHFLGNRNSPIVLDPCAGFGGRLLGFKSIYPNGKYIGIEPNPETYRELVNLALKFDNVQLYNCKFEDFTFDEQYKIDLTFTSIPYYDLERYSNTVEYNSYNHWKETFLTKILKSPNLILNIPYFLKSDITTISVPVNEYILRSNPSHFSKKLFKDELILKFF